MKILIISYMFPPNNAIGAVRIGKLAKELTIAGHEVRVIAGSNPRLSNSLNLEIDERCVTYVRENVRLDQSFGPLASLEARYRKGQAKLSRPMKRLIGLYRTMLFVPDPQVTWIYPAQKAIDDLLRSWTPDVIYASGPPFSSLVVASRVSEKHGVPWIAELRDLWTDSHYYEQPILRRSLEKRLERATLKTAAAIVTVSKPLAETLANRFAIETHVVLNGFDPADFGETGPAPVDGAASEKVSIVYTGLIYPGKRDPTPLFEALKKLGADANKVEVQFFGRFLPDLERQIAQYGLKDIVKIKGDLAYKDALRRQKEADVLLLLLWDTPEERGVYTGKLFEYVGAGRNILLVGCSEGVAADLVRTRKLGFASTNADEIAEILKDWIKQKSRDSALLPPPQQAKIGLSRREQFQRLEGIISRAVESRANPRPRVTLLGPRLDVGGTERHIVQISPMLRDRGIDVSVVTMSPGGALESVLTEAEVPLRSVHHSGQRGINIIKTIFRIRSSLRDLNPDIVHFYLAEPYILGSFGALLAGCKVKLMSRRSLARYQRMHRVAGAIERLLHRGLTAATGNSSAVCRELADEMGSSERILLIYNGVERIRFDAEPKTRSAVRKALGIEQDAFIIATLANLIPYKGHSDALQALSQVNTRLPQPWYWVLIGRDNGIGESLKAQARKLGLEDRVLFRGEVSSPEDLLKASDLGILPSHEEGFSNALIEAMACGLPMIASEVGGNCDAIESGESGILFKVRDTAALADAILTLSQNPEMRLRLSENASRRVQNKFSLEACIDQYVSLYNGILGRP